MTGNEQNERNHGVYKSENINELALDNKIKVIIVRAKKMRFKRKDEAHHIIPPRVPFSFFFSFFLPHVKPPLKKKKKQKRSFVSSFRGIS